MTNAVNIAQSGSNNQTMRNRIINGAMVISQRNGTSSVNATDGLYTLDRWRCGASANSVFSVQQSTVAPAGFSNSLLVTSLAATLLGTNSNFEMMQFIEGFNTYDLAWGTANAQPVTLSFWVRSSLTGTFGGSLMNATFNRSYPFSYTISAANTFEYKTVTIAGDTGGTWVGATNGIGVVVNFGLGVGTGRSGTAGAWASSEFYSATGATSVVGTNGATFYITGVQLEEGTAASPFETRLYGTELQLCQRYFHRITSGNSSTGGIIGMGSQTSMTGGYIYVSISPPMRATPTVAFNSLVVSDSATFDASASANAIVGTQDSIYLDVSYASSGAGFRPINLRASTNSSGRLDMISEL